MGNGTGLDSPLWSLRWAAVAVVLAILLGWAFS
jgi:hypothetical protein